jgi:hypothetical protein
MAYHNISKNDKPEKTELEKKQAVEEKDKSFVGSLTRIAKHWRESAKYGGYRDLAEGAKALEAEADLLDPSRVRNREEKQKLADKHAQEAKVAAEKAEASKADSHSA